jgi:hypothetical protein
VTSDLFQWQIGSKGPPQVCLCCGMHFDDSLRRVHGPYHTGPYIYVCEACWGLPFLFFPDKVLGPDGISWFPSDNTKPTKTGKNHRKL